MLFWRSIGLDNDLTLNDLTKSNSVPTFDADKSRRIHFETKLYVNMIYAHHFEPKYLLSLIMYSTV